MLLAGEFSTSSVRSVLLSRALVVVDGIDGRSVSPEILGRLAELADVAGALGFDDEATRLHKLLQVARKGYAVDLTRAALACLADDVTS